MVTQSSENCLKFPDINAYASFSDTRFATCGSIFKNNLPAYFYIDHKTQAN